MHKRWRPVVVSVVVAAALAVVVTVATVSEVGLHRSNAAVPPDPAAASSDSTPGPIPGPCLTKRALAFGVALSGQSSQLDAVARQVGEAPTLVMKYYDFDQPPPLAELQRLREREQTLVISWEPWKWGGGIQQPAFAVKRIAAGDFDSYLSSWATALAGWKHPVMLRFAHEMNLKGYPWADTVDGNTPGEYVAAWRHVHDLFVADGATNVSWIWAPNVPAGHSQPLARFFPGRAYVDVLALDGYNFGTSRSWSHWVTPSMLFTAPLRELRAVSPGMPIIITETGSAEQGGDKAVWSRELIRLLAGQKDVVAVIMFDIDKETDWRITSSPAAAAAFAKALHDRC